MRLADLDDFKFLVTIDMRLHFVELAAASRRKYGKEKVDVHDSQDDSGGGAHLKRPAVDLGAIAEGRPTKKLGIEIDADDRAMNEQPASPNESRAVAEGVFKQNTQGDSLLDLEQHRGVYARMASLAPPPEEVRTSIHLEPL